MCECEEKIMCNAERESPTVNGPKRLRNFKLAVVELTIPTHLKSTAMKFTQLFLALFLPALSLASDDVERRLVDDLEPTLELHRRLTKTTLSGICTDILADALDLISLDIRSQISCSCSPTLFPIPKFSASCQSANRIPDDPDAIVSGIPVFKADFGIGTLLSGGLPFSYDVCLSEVFFAGDQIPAIEFLGPWCLSLGRTLLEMYASGEFSPDSVQENQAFSESSVPQTFSAQSRDCDARVGDTACQYCHICDNGGVEFDCTNTGSEHYKSHGCVDLGFVPTSVFDIVFPNRMHVPDMD